ncbi:MAG TPA: ABC transporter permease [Fimbriimonadaceae bacterium]|nr:ABC transporter permease [Fimbriimonadaceae bacterium]
MSVAALRGAKTETLTGFVSKTFAIVGVEIAKLRRDPTDLFSRAVQPALWMLVFGQVFSHTRAIPTGNVRYMDFMAPGILAQSVLFTSIFYGLSAIWERDLGILQKYLVSPAPRGALVLGKALSAGARGLAQATIVYVLALALGVRVSWSPLGLLGVILTVVVGAAFFSTLSLIIACIVRSRERFMGIGQVLTMPLFFASNAIYPVSMMPGWLQVLSKGNPLTYEVDLLRSLMIPGAVATMHLGLDAAVLSGSTFLFILIASQMYPRLGT